MKRIRSNWLVGLFLMLLAHSAPAEETIKVALNIPLSGPFANIGEIYVNSAQFAIDDINARGGVMGRKFEIVAFDNKNSPQDALLVLKRITDQHIPVHDPKWRFTCCGAAGRSDRAPQRAQSRQSLAVSR